MDQQTVTYVVDDYLVSASRPGLGKPYVEPGCMQYTGIEVPMPGLYLVKLKIDDDWVIFDIDDATQLTGPVE